MTKEKLFASGLYSLVQNVLGLLFGFGGFFLLARILSKEAFGTWAIFMTTVSLLEVARNGMIQNAKIKFLNDFPDSEPEIIRASLAINIFMSCATALAIGFLGSFIGSLLHAPPLFATLLWISAITTIVLIPFSQLNILQQSRLNFGPVLAAVAIRAGLFFGYILYHYIMAKEINLVHLAVMQLIAACSGSLVALLGIGKQLVIADYTNWYWVKKLVGYGKFVFGTNVSAVLYSSADQYVLSAMTSLSKVGVYNAAVRINTLAEVPIATVASILYPYKVQLHKQGDNEATHLVFYKGIGAIVGLLLPIVLLCLAVPEFILTIIASSKFVEAAPILRILSIAILIQPFLRQFGTQMDSSGHPHINFAVAALMAVLNFGLNYFFIGWLGINGAAIATLTTQFTFLVIAAWLLNKYFEIRIFRSLYYLTTGYIMAWKKLNSIIKR
jgi:O-antigen/teichoic acid export membrane protein